MSNRQEKILRKAKNRKARFIKIFDNAELYRVDGFEPMTAWRDFGHIFVVIYTRIADKQRHAVAFYPDPLYRDLYMPKNFTELMRSTLLRYFDSHPIVSK